MKKRYYVIIGLAVLILILIITMGGQYNSLVQGRENVRSAGANVQTQLQRRNDLIPNLVETVKGYAAHEEKVIADVAAARARLAGAQTPEETVQGDAALSSALSRLLVVVENYPELKADANFRQLMDELAGTENRIAVARKDYNDTAQAYNKTVQVFPAVLFARMFGFETTPYFEAQPGAEYAPEVKFGD